MMMKSMIAGAAVIAMLAGGAAMTKNTDTPVLGGWTETENTAMTEEMKEMFDEATETLIGVNYEAVELMETQLVNGTNYKFRAEAQVVYPGAEKKEAIVTVHKALDGTLSVLDIETCD